MLRRLLLVCGVALAAFVGLPVISGCDGGGGVEIDSDVDNKEANEKAMAKKAAMEAQKKAEEDAAKK